MSLNLPERTDETTSLWWYRSGPVFVYVHVWNVQYRHTAWTLGFCIKYLLKKLTWQNISKESKLLYNNNNNNNNNDDDVILKNRNKKCVDSSLEELTAGVEGYD